MTAHPLADVREIAITQVRSVFDPRGGWVDVPAELEAEYHYPLDAWEHRTVYVRSQP